MYEIEKQFDDPNDFSINQMSAREAVKPKQEQSKKSEKPPPKRKPPKIDSTIAQIKVENQSFFEQQKIKKVLIQEDGGDSGTDYESDSEATTTMARGSRKEGDMFGEYAFRKDKIFKYLTIQDKMVRIPD